MIGMVNAILNVHRFRRHAWKGEVPRQWRNLGAWKYLTTFKYCYPNIPEILTDRYGLSPDDRIMVFITREVCLPHFNRYRTRFRKVFHGTLQEYRAYLKDFMKGRQKPSRRADKAHRERQVRF